MSQQRLANFLNKLHSELSKDSEEYRRLTGNKKYTTFTYKSYHIRKALKVLLNKASNFDESGAQIIKQVNIQLTPRLNTLTSDIRTAFAQAAAASNGSIEVRQVRGGITALLKESENAKGQQRDNFNTIKNIYKKHLDSFYEDFLNILNSEIIRPSSSNKSGFTNVDTAGKAFNLEHLKNSSNIENLINDAIFDSLNDIYNDSSVPSELANELKNLGFTNILTIIKNAKEGKIEVAIGSQILNAAQSAKEKEIKIKLEKQLEKAIIKVGNIPSLSGSDSLVEASRKKHVKKIADSFSKKLKTAKVKITTEDTSIEESPAKSRNQKVTAKGVIARRAALTKKAPRARPRAGSQQDSIASQPLRLLAMLNARLPEVVASKMNPPALQYRSGRFANSVRATDIVQTRKGFPSIGYTYQRDPYEVFEMGGGNPKWSTPDRDPRKIIDQSIREIAVEFAMGRFYTRRV